MSEGVWWFCWTCLYRRVCTQLAGLLVNISLKWLLNLLCKGCVVIPTYCFTADGVCDFEVVVCAFGSAPNVWFGIEGFTCEAVIVTFFD